MDVEETQAKISKIDERIKFRKLFYAAGAIAIASPLLPLMQGESQLDLDWSHGFLIFSGVFVLVYAAITNRKETEARDRLQSELNAYQAARQPARKPTPRRRPKVEPVIPEDSGDQKCVQLTVHGRVTGVGYRFWFSRLAEKLKLTGYVRNISGEEDYVEAVVCGPSSRVDVIVEEAAIGPRWAEPTEVNVEETESPDMGDFQIR